MRTKSGRCAGVRVAVALLVAVLGVIGVRTDLVFAQAGGPAVADVCEPTAADMDFNGDEWIDFADFARL